MKYVFDMGEVWHVYADMGNQWTYYRMEQAAEEILNKKGDALPGPLGRLDLLKQLEEENRMYKEQIAQMKQQFEISYVELKEMAEKMQEEGRMWRQRYLDLAYQMSPKGK